MKLSPGPFNWGPGEFLRFRCALKQGVQLHPFSTAVIAFRKYAKSNVT